MSPGPRVSLLVGENASGYAWGEVDPFKKDHPRICCWAQQILRLNEEVMSGETRKEYTRWRTHAVLLFLFFFSPPSFLSSFSFPERLVAADGHSICFLVNFQPDNLDWIRKKIGKIDITRNEIHFKN